MLKRKTMLLIAVTAAATPASASDKQDFEICDGRPHPGRKADGMRAAANSLSYSALLRGRSDVVAACTRALASPRLLPTQTLRKAHLLRARAAARLQAGGATEALQDLDLALAAAPEITSDRFLERSMGVSITLLRALAHAQAGDLGAATPLARAAATRRPYALQVQQVVANILQAARPPGDTSPSPWLALTRLEPDAGATALIKEAEVGNYPGVLALRPAVVNEWPEERPSAGALVLADPNARRLLSTVIVSLHTAYARAATGDAAGARRDLADVRSHLAKPGSEPAEKSVGSAATGLALLSSAKLSEALDKFVDTRARQIEARIAVLENRPSEAIAALVAAPMPKDAATLDLLTALKSVVPAENAALVPDLEPFREAAAEGRRAVLADIAPAALIAPETARAVIEYDRARPDVLGALVGGVLSMGTSLLGGINRTDGFRSTANPDGTIKVEFLGNTPSAALVQEMTLLRAAELVRAAKASAFVITDRSDSARRLVTTQYGAEISSKPTGFKTELTIRPLASGAETPGSFDALTVIDALGPLYYEAKP